MLVPVNWLNEYVKVDDLALRELEDAMIMSGSNTENIRAIEGDMKNIVMAKLVSIRPHPDADKLVICQVDAGEQLQIVTGASNMKVGDYLPLAKHQSIIHDGTLIKKGKLRGVISEGMLCSLSELGFSDQVIAKQYADGLYTLSGNYKLGVNFFAEAGLADHIIEFEITPNRPDCLSMIGIAREAAATLDRPLQLPSFEVTRQVGHIEGKIDVEITAAERCSRYACRMAQNVKIGPSPHWLQHKLIKAGMRPVNNIVDITNYVMLEYGQPIHAFDYDKISGAKITVRTARKQEKIKTIDGRTRQLTEDMLVIADSSGPLAIAGLMGGIDSEITAETSTLLIEVANFDKTSIRETSKALALRSEASTRFEKGLSPELVDEALNRVCALIEALQCADIVGGKIDVYPRPQRQPIVQVRAARVNQLIGSSLSPVAMAEILRRLDCQVEIKGDHLTVKPPYYRLDLIEEIDFVEEVARLYGYDKIASTLPRDALQGGLTDKQRFEVEVKDLLTGIGFSESVSYSFVGPSDLAALNDELLTKPNKRVVIRNPLGEEYSIMRPTMLANMLQIVARNLNRRATNLLLYEVGNTFETTDDLAGEPLETRHLALAVCGGTYDYYTLKGALDTLLQHCGIDSAVYQREGALKAYHPGRSAVVSLGGDLLGQLGQIHPSVAQNFGIEQPVYLAELTLATLFNHRAANVKYQALPKFPAATRDIAFTVSERYLHRDIVAIIHKNGGTYLDSVKLFDIYRGDQIAPGEKSMAYALSFRATDRTLSDKDIDPLFQSIVDALQRECRAKLRAI